MRSTVLWWTTRSGTSVTLSSSVSYNSSIPSIHSFNKIDCFVYSFCFCFIGFIELQIGRRLYLQGLRDSESWM
ncbi:hypothetical protein HN51_027872 [Arachis hypogaea]